MCRVLNYVYKAIKKHRPDTHQSNLNGTRGFGFEMGLPRPRKNWRLLLPHGISAPAVFCKSFVFMTRSILSSFKAIWQSNL